MVKRSKGQYILYEYINSRISSIKNYGGGQTWRFPYFNPISAINTRMCANPHPFWCYYVKNN